MLMPRCRGLVNNALGLAVRSFVTFHMIWWENFAFWEGYALRCAPRQSVEWRVNVQRPPLFTEATMPSRGNTTQARVIALLFAVRLAGSASWRCSVNIEGDPSQVLVYTVASMRCFSDAAKEQNLTVYADASLLLYASSFTGEAF